MEEIHPLLSDRARLSIMARLAASPKALSFNLLLEELGLTRGNLSSHLRRLEEAKLIHVEKRFADRKPLSEYSCSSSGKKELKKYLEIVERALRAIS